MALRTENVVYSHIFKLIPRGKLYHRYEMTEGIFTPLIGLIPIKARIEFKLSCLVHIALKTHKPHYLKQALSLTRTRIFVPRVRTNFGKRSFSYSGPSIYNSLPRNLRNIEDLRTFKKKLKTHLFTSAYDLTTLTINENYKL